MMNSQELLTDLPAMLTVRQAAKVLFSDDDNSSRNRVYDWIHNGDLQAKKSSGKWWVTKEEMRRVIG